MTLSYIKSEEWKANQWLCMCVCGGRGYPPNNQGTYKGIRWRATPSSGCVRQHCALRLVGGMTSQWNCWQYHSVLWGHIKDGYEVRGRQSCCQTSGCCVVTASSRQPLQSSSSSSVNRDHNHVHGNSLLWELSMIMYARHLTWYVYSKRSVNISNTKRNTEEVPSLFHSTGCSEGLGALPPTRDLWGNSKKSILSPSCI